MLSYRIIRKEKPNCYRQQSIASSRQMCLMSPIPIQSPLLKEPKEQYRLGLLNTQYSILLPPSGFNFFYEFKYSNGTNQKKVRKFTILAPKNAENFFTKNSTDKYFIGKIPRNRTISTLSSHLLSPL